MWIIHHLKANIESLIFRKKLNFIQIIFDYYCIEALSEIKLKTFK